MAATNINPHKLRWLRLDNAAKIYPAARNQNWSNVFRMSATMSEEVDRAVLQSALDVTVRRFPSIAARLRRGVFWYYLQQLEQVPEIREEYCHPLTKMSRDEVRKCALRVIVYKNRIAVEMFHSLTDGNGALIFLKSLLAEYVQQRYHIAVPNADGILDRREEPKEEELEDSFLKHEGNACATRGGFGVGGAGVSIMQLRGADGNVDISNVTTGLCYLFSAGECANKCLQDAITSATDICPTSGGI